MMEGSGGRCTRGVSFGKPHAKEGCSQVLPEVGSRTEGPMAVAVS